MQSMVSLRGLVVVVALLFSACSDKESERDAFTAENNLVGGDAGPLSAPPIKRLPLALDYVEAPEFGDPRTVSQLFFEDTMPEGVDVQKGKATWVKRHRDDPKGPKLMCLKGKPILVDLPLPSNPAQVNQVALTFSNVGKCDISVEMRRGGARPIKTAIRRVTSEEVQVSPPSRETSTKLGPPTRPTATMCSSSS